MSTNNEPQPDTGCVYESTLQPSEFGSIQYSLIQILRRLFSLTSTCSVFSNMLYVMKLLVLSWNKELPNTCL